MRSNLPVTNIEHTLHDADTIVSKTDLRGNITYVNQSFINISGFSEAELIGAPQNIVRHPDMPTEAFADFWNTLRSGRAWTGMVKNRCKNGDHYWVEANASPLIEDRKIVGYASIRTKASRVQIQAAETAYRAIKSGDQSLEIRDGNVVKRTFSPYFEKPVAEEGVGGCGVFSWIAVCRYRGVGLAGQSGRRSGLSGLVGGDCGSRRAHGGVVCGGVLSQCDQTAGKCAA